MLTSDTKKNSPELSLNNDLNITETKNTTSLRLECNICNRKFHKEIHLIKHKSIHDNSRPLKCHYCNKRFNLMWHLKRHELIHSDNKPFNCYKCSKSFCTKCELRRHINYSHYGIKEYHCNLCDRSFTLKSNLKVHMRKHTGEKPYQCNLCDRSFYQSGHLTYHLKRHTNEPNKINNQKQNNSPISQSTSFEDESNYYKTIHYTQKDLISNFLPRWKIPTNKTIINYNNSNMFSYYTNKYCNNTNPFQLKYSQNSKLDYKYSNPINYIYNNFKYPFCNNQFYNFSNKIIIHSKQNFNSTTTTSNIFKNSQKSTKIWRPFD